MHLSLVEQLNFFVLKYFLFLLGIICLASCSVGGPDVTEVKNMTTKITFSFHDSSVPPEYHRSYQIDVTASEVHIVVDSYGDILQDETYAITKAQFDGVVQAFLDCKIKNCNLKDDGGCTGGTGHSIERYEGENQVFKGYAYHCGKEDSGDMCGDIDTFGNKVEELIPDMMSLLK